MVQLKSKQIEQKCRCIYMLQFDDIIVAYVRYLIMR